MILTWFTSRMEVTSTELCFLIAQGKVKHSSAAPHMQLKIFSLRSSFDLYCSPTIYSSLSVDPCGSLHAYSISQLLVTVRLLPLITEPELGFYNSLMVCKTLLRLSDSTNWPTNQPTKQPTLLQYKIYPFIGSPKVLPLQHCGPVPTVTQNPN